MVHFSYVIHNFGHYFKEFVFLCSSFVTNLHLLSREIRRKNFSDFLFPKCAFQWDLSRQYIISLENYPWIWFNVSFLSVTSNVKLSSEYVHYTLLHSVNLRGSQKSVWFDKLSFDVYIVSARYDIDVRCQFLH